MSIHFKKPPNIKPQTTLKRLIPAAPHFTHVLGLINSGDELSKAYPSAFYPFLLLWIISANTRLFVRQFLSLIKPIGREQFIMSPVVDIAPEPETLPSNDPAEKPHSKITLNRILLGVQKYSAYGFEAFALLHFAGVIFAPVISPSLGETTISVGRTIYQSAVGEPILIYASAGLHIASGLVMHGRRIYHERKTRGKWNFKSSVIQKSGYITTMFLAGHFLALRGGVLWNLDGDSSLIGLDYVRWTMTQGWLGSISLLLLVTTFTHHTVLGLNRWLKLRLSGRKRNSIVVATTLMALISLIRIGRLPVPTGWQVEHFEKAYGLITALHL